MNEHDDAYVDAMLMVNMQANTRSVTLLLTASRGDNLRLRHRCWYRCRCNWRGTCDGEEGTVHSCAATRHL